MRSKTAFCIFIMLLFTISSCKKDDVQQVESFCPGSMTYVTEVTDKIGTADLLGIYEDKLGNIHIEVNDNGAWKVHQFASTSAFIRTVNLGSYNTNKHLAVSNAYYLSDYEVSSTVLNSSEILTGYKDMGVIQYSESFNRCGKYFIYDTLVPYAETLTTTTSIQKLNFDGNAVWLNTFEGYSPLASPVSFDEKGNPFLLTVDYKGKQWQLLINGALYEFADANRPTLSLTDTMMINDKNHSLIVTKIDPSNGAGIWTSRKLLNQFYPYDLYNISLTVTASAIWVNTPADIYTWDLQGNFQHTLSPVYNECHPKRTYNLSKAFTDGNNLLVAGLYYPNTSNYETYYARVDIAGNTIWTTSNPPNTLYSNICTLPSGGFMGSNEFNMKIFDASGNPIRNISRASYIITAFPAEGNVMVEKCLSKSSCSGDLLHIFMKTGSRKSWIIRTKENGDM